MKYPIEVKEEARQDIIDAAGWYREKQPGLDKKFIAAIEEAMQRISLTPTAGRKLYRSFRETSLKKFPFVIVYEIIFDSIVIYQVFHISQNPRKKSSRLKK